MSFQHYNQPLHKHKHLIEYFWYQFIVRFWVQIDFFPIIFII